MGRKRKPEDRNNGTDAPVAPVPAATAPSPVDGLEGEGGPTVVRVRKRAQEIYEQRQAMGLPGSAEGDWLQAKAELGSQTKAKP